MKIRNLLPISVVFIVACLSASAVHAEDFQWIEPAGGNFGDSDKWSPTGPPSITDRAMFELPDAYTVTFDDDYANDQLFIDSGDVTFDLSGHVYHLEFSEPWDDSAVIGHIGSARLSINGGAVESRNCTLGRNQGSTGELVISTDGHWVAFKNADGWHSIWIGHAGEGKLTVENGGEVRQGAGAAASQPGSHRRHRHRLSMVCGWVVRYG
jgi:T5SS/PEP-CTERM-associated repeat protein